MEPKFGAMDVFKKPYDSMKLPDRGEMLERLMKVRGDSADLRERLYVPLLEKEKRQMAADGIVTTLATALGEYENADPPPEVRDAAKYAEGFIEALTPGAKKDLTVAAIREAAKQRWRELHPVALPDISP